MSSPVPIPGEEVLVRAVVRSVHTSSRNEPWLLLKPVDPRCSACIAVPLGAVLPKLTAANLSAYAASMEAALA